MTTMVPAREQDTRSLADVLPSCVAALRGEPNALDLGPASSVVVVVVDGLGSSSLKQRAAYARTLSVAPGALWSGFPTTTASALTTLTTGTLPGSHGLVGYSLLDPANDRVVKQLSGWDAGLLDPLTWQREPTVFEGLAGSDITAYSVGPARYATSGLTKAILRGATYRAAETVAARFDAAAGILRSSERSLVYLYVPELDMAGHKFGWQSEEWSRALEQLDSELARLVGGLRPDQGVVVTADHGVVDIPAHKHVLFGAKAELMTGVRHVGGEPRCLQLYFEPELGQDQRDALVEAWRVAEGHRSWVVTRAEAIEADWFGPVAAEVEPRIGDLLVAARKGIAYYRNADDRSRGMVGQHGSWSPDETQVPLARFGAFA